MNLFAFNFLLNALWQIPLVFCASRLAARLARRNGPQWEHRIWVTALFSELFLPLAQLDLKSIAAWFLALFTPIAPTTANASVSAFTGPATNLAPTWNLPPLLITLVLAAWAAATLFFTARLCWRLHKTSTLRHHAHIISAEEYPVLHNFLSTLSSPPQILVSQAVSGPAIIGILHPALLLPPSFLDDTQAADIEAALAHELAHLRRRDCAKTLFYEILALPIAWHPVAWLTRSHIAESREILCDHLAAEFTQGPQAYARALLRLASQQSVRSSQPIHAIGIFDTQSLERRIMQLTQSQIRNSLARRITTIAACAILALATGASALALHSNTATGPSGKVGPKPAYVSAGAMAGNRISGENPKYPVEAKKKHIQGTVVLAAVISRQGRIQSLHVVQGPEMLRNASLTAVRTWRYKPFFLNGRPIAVETTIHVIFSLGAKSRKGALPPPPTPPPPPPPPPPSKK